MNYSESMSKRQQRRKAINQRFRRMFLVALLMGLAMGFIFGRCSAVNSKAPDAPIEPDQLKDTSIEVIHTADGGAMRNEDVSKNAALIPPVFGSESMNALHTGEYLTPNLAPRTLPTAGAVISGSGDVVTPGSTVSSGNGYQPSVLFTDVTSDLYYKNGSLGKIEIPTLGLSVRIYQGTDSKTLVKGVGHFEDTSIWEGNVCLAAHNRGANSCFGRIHTLDIGDKITLTTKLGTRTYKVTDVSKVSETDRSGLADSAENMLTLYTCVRNQRDQRWCVTAVET